MKQKFINLILAFAMLFAFAPCVHAVDIIDSGNCGTYDDNTYKYSDNATYTLDSDGTLTISGEGEIGYNMGCPWKANKDNIKKVIINNGITKICCSAFAECNLTEIEIPNTLKTADVGAFRDCYIDKVYIDDFETWCNISWIGDATPLSNGAHLYINDELATEITFPSNITTIDNNMIRGCTSVKNVIIPNGVTRIESKAFNNCSNLRSVTIPHSITSIRAEYISTNKFACPFDNCENLETIYYDGAKIELSVISYWQVWTNIEDINIVCTQDTITGECGDNIEWKIECIDNKNVLTVNGTGAIDETVAGRYIGYVDKVIINSGITKIGNSSFTNCGAEEVIISDGVTYIGEDAFWLSSVKKVEIPDSVIYIGKYAFQYCFIESLKLPKGVTELYDHTFSMNHTLKQIYIPKNLGKINDAFIGCGLTDVYYEGTEEEWNNSSVSDTSQFSELSIRVFEKARIHFNAIGMDPPRFRNAEVFPPTASAPASVAVTLDNVEYDNEIITAFYKDGVIVDMTTTPISTGEKNTNIPVTAADADTAKVFIWNSLNSMKPLCAAETVNLNAMEE